MNIISTDGTILKFNIDGYEFPNVNSGFDSNWLILHLLIKRNRVLLNHKDPSIQTSELLQLVRWFLKMLLGKLVPNQYWSPLEDTFSFEYIGTKEEQFEFRFYPRDVFSVGSGTPFSLEFQYSDKELARIIQTLINLSRKFPIRDLREKL